MTKTTKRRNPVYNKFPAVSPRPVMVLPYARPRVQIPRGGFNEIRVVKTKVLTGTPVIYQATSAGGDNVATFTFMFNMLADSTSYAQVFDQYRIKRVKAIIQGLNGNMSGQTLTSAPGPCMVTVLDYDDNTALASYSAALNYSSAMIHHPNCNDVRVFKPRIAVSAISGNSSTNTGIINSNAQWIDSSTTNVPHYGLKVYQPKAGGAGAQLFSYQITFEIVVELRNTR